MNILTPRKALNKAFLKQKVYREEMERFKTNLLKMLHDKNENESEEYHKNMLSAFLKETWYKDLHFINTRERTDLAIHEKASSDSAPAVLIETKKPGNKSEMPAKDDLNAKALHELIRYYLHERVDNENKFIKHLIVTDLNAFFIFDENEFDKYVYGNRQVMKDYEEYKNSGKGTDFFYNQVALPLVADIGDKLTFTCFELKEFQRYLKNGDPEKEKKLIPYYKLLAPEHLLKKPFANDSNTLDRHFYNELLHIIGLKEVKQGSQKLIQRAPEAERQPGSLVENAINILQSEDIIGYFNKKEQYGSDRDEQAFNIALELVITWINRILFLKLLEAQLVRYHRGDAGYKFLNIDTLPDYDALNKLFFQVLAVEPGERNDNVREHFSKIPYLNSSLFEPNELERSTVRISNLEDEHELPYLGHTILKDNKGRRRSGKENTLRYFFEFLEAYDFASEGSEDIQEENKNLINASVLGLIFEKINGYRDGSFFTPGFITEYMARETIRRAVVQKFNEAKGWQIDDFEALREKIEPNAEGRAEANRIINSLKVVDPAVGSGHFLVSALNEMIALKSELKVLSYRSGDRIKLYRARVENDELIVEDHEEGGIFEYNLSRSHTPVPEKQALQEALFHEKQTIIENCLFGVDINPNSVKICRLRLWIELLKNAYYQIPEQKTPTASGLELQTLPNIDINIKAGNSLVSRFALDTPLDKALRNSNWNIRDYRNFVQGYKNPKNKEERIANLEVIKQIKKEFSQEIHQQHPKQKKLDKFSKELYEKYTGNRLFEEKLTHQQKKDRQKLEKQINKLQTEIDELKNSEIYRNAFEWRFEFPEVLDDEGNFKGFDVAIGNPPYIYNRDLPKKLRDYLKEVFYAADDLYVYFTYEGISILKKNGFLSLITPNTYFTLSSRGKFRNEILKHSSIKLTYSGFCFEDAYVETMIMLLSKRKAKKDYVTFVTSPNDYVSYNSFNAKSNVYTENIFNRFFIPTSLNKKLNKQLNAPLKKEAEKFTKKLSGRSDYESEVEEYNMNLNPGDLTLMGLISDGEQGLVTGNNSRYIARIINSEEELDFIYERFISILNTHTSDNISVSDVKENPGKYYKIADEIKEKTGNPNLFGRFFLYKCIYSSEVYSFSELSEEIKENGSNHDLWVNYYQGNPKGYKWHVPYNTCINWNKQYVKELKEGIVTNSRWQGYNYFGSSGFGWVDYFTKRIKAFFLEEGIYSKNIVKLHSSNKNISDKYIVALLNSNFINYYVKNFVTSTHTLQINDGRLIPIIVPSKKSRERIEELVDKILYQKKGNPELNTGELEKQIDEEVYQLYDLSDEDIREVEKSVN